MEKGSRYEVVYREKYGRVVLATCDIEVGSVVMSEEPLLMIPSEEIMKLPRNFDDELNIFLLIFRIFLNLSVEIQNKLLDLFYIIRENEVEQLRKIYSERFDEEDTNTIIKLALIYKYNAFGDHDGNRMLYDHITRISHSCEPNCYLKIKGSSRECRAIRNIKSGEEITISYNSRHDFETSYLRRENYMKTKDFLCECPRCILPDDTRQFNCNCGGVYYINQLNRTDTPEFVKCYKCNTIPDEKNQMKMLQLEQNLEDVGNKIFEQYKNIADSLFNFEVSKNDKDNTVNNGLKAVLNMKELLNFTDNLQFPSRHYLSRNIIKTQILAASFVLKFDNPINKNRDRLINYCNLYIENIEGVMKIINITVCEAYYFMAGVLIWENSTPDDFNISKYYLQKAIRYYKILENEHLEKYNSLLLKILNNTKNNSPECAFCNEISKNHCSKCKKIKYCSKECQISHWKIHKKYCNKS